jgi:hypothetical protein
MAMRDAMFVQPHLQAARQAARRIPDQMGHAIVGHGFPPVTQYPRQDIAGFLALALGHQFHLHVNNPRTECHITNPTGGGIPATGNGAGHGTSQAAGHLGERIVPKT